MNKSMLKQTRHTLRNLLLPLALIVPTAGFSAPGQLAESPLFLAQNVKHNLMLVIDDSGSMQFEMLFPGPDGQARMGADGKISDTDGIFRESGSAYSDIFPDDEGSWWRIPPFRVYAAVRTAAFNPGYYDPLTTYAPWPSYGGFTWPASDPVAAKFDPTKTTTINLTQDWNTANDGFADSIGSTFVANNNNTICSDTGTKCGGGGNAFLFHATFFPATYYVVNNTSTFTQTNLASVGFNTGDSLVIEAESGILSGNMKKATTDTGIIKASLAAAASDGDYIGTRDGAFGNSGTAPSADTAQYTFTAPATGQYTIWLRHSMPDGNGDSFFLRLQGFGQNDLTLKTANNDTWSGNWNQWWQGHPTDANNWSWEPWVTTNGNLQASQTYTLDVARREDGAMLDQILITRSAATPSGQVALVSATPPIDYSCATPDPNNYNAYFADPTKLNSADGLVNALAPNGQCLTEVKINTANATLIQNLTGRTLAQEQQNFANWFTYWRKRHQAVRGGMAAALQGISGVRAGLFWINDQRAVVMRDLDNTSDLNTLLDDNYKHIGSGGTPNRSALWHARSEYQRTNAGAPIQNECQKNFTLLFTDGFTSPQNIDGLGNEDVAAGAPYQDAESDTLGDIAYKTYIENPRPAITPLGKVRTPTACDAANPSPLLDCNKNLHINTFTAGLGATGTFYNLTHFKVADAFVANNTPSWPDIGSSQDKRMIDDLYHAAVNGRGDIYNARTPAELKNELGQALQDIVAAIGAASSVTFNTTSVETNTLVYAANFNSTSWSGDLTASALNTTNGEIVTDPVTGSILSGQVWSAGSKLDARSLAGDPRRIITASNNGTRLAGVPFQLANLDATQQADLQFGGDATLGQQRVDFLRGETAQEGALLRERASRLGDIINSSPVFVGAPQFSWPDEGPFGVDGARYSNFRIAQKDRLPLVYVGANDGMLHAFEATPAATGGREVFAYVPNLVYANQTNDGLHFLTQKDYVHRTYVDLTPSVADAYISGKGGAGKAWRTLLLGGLRGGGPGLFALDVTNPSNLTESNADNVFLWEFTHPKLGLMTDLVQIALLKVGNSSYKWVAVFGNGFNSGSGETGLFLVDLEGGMDGVWSVGDIGSNDVQYILLEGSTTAPKDGLNSGVRLVDTDGDRVVDRIYAGDLAGNIWVVGASSNGSWDSVYKQGSTPKPLFTATDANGVRQPITAAPRVAVNLEMDKAGNEPNLMVYFGTGQYLSNGDLTNTQTQTFYGVWDHGTKSLTRSSLIPRTLSVVSTPDGPQRRSEGASVQFGTANNEGWLVDFNIPSGERMVFTPLIRDNVIFFDTLIPSSSACSGGGNSFLMAFDLDGSTPDKQVFDTNNDGVIDSNDQFSAGKDQGSLVTSGSKILDDNVISQTSDGTLIDTKINDGKNNAGRLGWREINQ